MFSMIVWVVCAAAPSNDDQANGKMQSQLMLAMFVIVLCVVSRALQMSTSASLTFLHMQQPAAPCHTLSDDNPSGWLQVTVLDEIEEEWPVARERAHEVITSAVTLEPKSTEVPEIGTEQIEVEVRQHHCCE